MRRLAAWVIFVAACGAGAGRVAEPSGGEQSARERPVLTVPPSAGTAAALGRFAGAAERGDGAAAWERLHELVDLFDAARAGHDGAARALILQALAVPDDAHATDGALDALLVEVDRLLERDRLNADAQAARTLLEWDRHPPARRPDLFLAATAVRALARGGGPLAANAELRLALFCAGAFRDAPRLVARDRPRALASCLYSLYEADPAPYVDADAARRPPQPSWSDLDAGLTALLGRLGSARSRIAPSAARVLADHKAVIADAEPKGLLPRPLDPHALRLPWVAAAPPFDWEPLIFVSEPTADELARFETELGTLLAADGRGRAALALTSDAPAKSFLAVAALARRLGADTVELAVGWDQTIKAPPGDYGFGRSADGHVGRVGVIGLAFVGGSAWDPARAGLGLTLVVSPRRWQIVAPSGALPAIDVGADAAPAAAALRRDLKTVLDAFPDEAALAVVPDGDVNVGALAAALAAARARPLLLGLAETAPRPASGRDFAVRAARRAAAEVTIRPDTFSDRVPSVRRCYQDALDRDPKTAGTLDVEAGPRVVSGPANELLRRCIVSRLAEKMAADKTQSVRVELKLERR
jgi:hypothetical protein